MAIAVDTPEQRAKGARDSRSLVLVVDDEESYRQGLASGLSREGFAVEVAADGHEALRLFHRIHPDLVLLDVMLPDSSGVEVCRTLKNDPKTASVTIVMLTAKAQSADLEEAEDAGADGYFTKPFSPVALLRRVDKIFKGE